MGVAAVQHSFSGHETFPFRYPWLKKGFDAVLEEPWFGLPNLVRTLRDGLRGV